MTPYESHIEHPEPDATRPPVLSEIGQQDEGPASRFDFRAKVKSEARLPSEKRKSGPDGEPARCETRRPSKEEIWRGIRRHCRECAGSAEVVQNCPAGEDGCNLYPFRLGLRTKKQVDGKLAPEFRKSNLLKTIRAECTECLGSGDVDLCTSPRCSLYPFRGGTRARIQQLPL